MCPYIQQYCAYMHGTVCGRYQLGKTIARVNFKPIEPKVETKEEWVDDTKNWEFRHDGVRLVARKGSWVMWIAPRDLCAMDGLDGGYRMVEGVTAFRIERRVEKKVCAECGREI